MVARLEELWTSRLEWSWRVTLGGCLGFSPHKCRILTGRLEGAVAAAVGERKSSEDMVGFKKSGRRWIPGEEGVTGLRLDPKKSHSDGGDGEDVVDPTAPAKLEKSRSGSENVLSRSAGAKGRKSSWGSL